MAKEKIELYPIYVNKKLICYATSIQNAKLVSQSMYYMRGFFAEGFEEVTIGVEAPITKEQL